jgi:hypothetical protein
MTDLHSGHCAHRPLLRPAHSQTAGVEPTQLRPHRHAQAFAVSV